MDKEEFDRVKELIEDLKEAIADTSAELCELKFWKGCKILTEAVAPLIERMMFLARIEAKRPVRELEEIEEEDLLEMMEEEEEEAPDEYLEEEEPEE